MLLISLSYFVIWTECHSISGEFCSLEHIIVKIKTFNFMLVLLVHLYKKSFFFLILVESTSSQNAQTVSELPKELMDNELLPKYKRDLVAKLKCLRAELNALQPQSGHCRLEVSRNEIFEVSNFLKLFTYFFFNFSTWLSI